MNSKMETDMDNYKYENAIEIKEICKKYKDFSLNNVSFNVPKGSIVGFIGQNGAGKTTTIKSVLNIIKTDSGRINIFGMDNVKDEKKIKEDIAVVFDEIPFQEEFTPNNLNKIMKSIYDSWDEAVYKGYVEMFGIPYNKKIGELSKGMKMKLQIATALSHNARLLIMDEATGGLDPVVRSEILDIFFDFIQDESNSILMSSHITSDLEKIADYIVFIDKGNILLSGYKDDILSGHAIIKCAKDEFVNIDKEYIVSSRQSEFGVEALTYDISKFEDKYKGMVIDRATLEDIMVYYVKRNTDYIKKG